MYIEHVPKLNNQILSYLTNKLNIQILTHNMIQSVHDEFVFLNINNKIGS